MTLSINRPTAVCSLLLSLAVFSSQALAAPIFSDDFEDRVNDQALIGNDWTWYDQWFTTEGCTGEAAGGFGPFDDGNGDDYAAANRNFFTVPEGTGDYYRAGLEVPAWDGALSNMLRVYGNQYNVNEACQRTLIFQEMDAPAAGTYSFVFDVAQDRVGAPAAGEVTAAFVKVLDPANGYETILFETEETKPKAASVPLDVEATRQGVDFTITEEMVGKLLQFGFYNDVTPNWSQSADTSAALYDNISVGLMELGPAHSGSYYNVNQSGHGFSIEFGESGGSPLAVVYWYTYDSLGNPIFMLGNGVPDGNTVEITFESPVGMKYGEFDPETVTREPGGTAVFVFSDRDNATFSYTPSDFSVNQWGHTSPIVDLPLIKAFGIPADKYFGSSE
ncbi:MAG: hypothetical protein WBN41_09040 [Lysobacterales bacterium]